MVLYNPLAQPKGAKAMKEHPGRCLQAMNRVASVIRIEFDDLTPPDAIFVLNMLLFTYLETGHKRINELPKE